MTQLRFEFGQNWQRFLQLLDEDRITAAERSLQYMLDVQTLIGSSFLDVGCGSGLFSLAARRLGAQVYSFDYDQNSVLCARELKQRFYPDDPNWTIERASILNEAYVSSLGGFDIVYAWGVLHHTGAMWRALEATCRLVAAGGTLFIAIYNDQGAASQRWAVVKRAYNRSPGIVRAGIVLGAGAFIGAQAALTGLAQRRPVEKRSGSPRGMSRWHDLIDWVGGYPFEVSKPEPIIAFVRERGFDLQRLSTVRDRIGCNEYVFRRI